MLLNSFKLKNSQFDRIQEVIDHHAVKGSPDFFSKISFHGFEPSPSWAYLGGSGPPPKNFETCSRCARLSWVRPCTLSKRKFANQVSGAYPGII